jgi:predicted ABC-type transport system involved in lysophospholipase L1 biosynthesis ATPase subunit
VSLEIADGEFVAIVGPSGCGKSTLLHVLAGFERPDRGAIEMDGRAIERPSPRAVLIAQRGSVFPWMTVRRNLLFGAVQSSAEEREAMAPPHRPRRPRGFEELPAQLGGMLQRVEVARADGAPDVLSWTSCSARSTRSRGGAISCGILRASPHLSAVTHDVEALHRGSRVVMTPRLGGSSACSTSGAASARAAPLVALSSASCAARLRGRSAARAAAPAAIGPSRAPWRAGARGRRGARARRRRGDRRRPGGASAAAISPRTGAR